VDVLGCRLDPYEFKRVLLWSSETQVSCITEEASRRTEMIVRQAERELTRKTLSREEFLSSLEVKISCIEIDSSLHTRVSRVLELVNKTNQFNTTGRRWTHHELSNWLEAGKCISGFIVEDKFSKYGLVAVVFYEPGRIEQFVMSCRVAGIDVERAVLSLVTATASGGGVLDVRANIQETQANMPVLDIYRSAGFASENGCWVLRKGDVLQMPTSLAVEI
jgi:FkbH-like protein